MDKIKVFALGGLDEAGRDCYVVEINDKLFVLDCGCSIPDKNTPGIDFLLPNSDYLIKNKNRISAYIMTHGHDENMGALKYFYHLAPAPIYVSEATKIILQSNAIQHGIKTQFDFRVVESSDERIIDGIKTKFFQTFHNASDSFGVALLTDRGYIVYTGDYIIDYSSRDKDFLFDLQGLSRVTDHETFLLMGESKFAGKTGYCSPRHRLYDLVKRSFKEDKKRIFISCFWENLYRIKEICDLCRNYGKKMYFYDKYTHDIMKTILETHPNYFSAENIIKREDFLRYRKQDVVILMLGRGIELYGIINALALGENEDKRIILSEDDLFINAALPSNTQEIAATKAHDNLYRTGCSVRWIKSKELIAMHAMQDDLKFFISFFKPKYYFPVRGSFVNLMSNAKLALSMDIGLNYSNVFVLDNGMELLFESERPRIIPNEVNKIEISPGMVDGKGITFLGEEIIEERRMLGQDGVVVVAGTVSLSEKKLIAGPDCQMRGFVYVKEAEPLLKSISQIYVDEIKTTFQGASNKPNFEETKLRIIDRARKFIKRDNGREPSVLPIIIILE